MENHILSKQSTRKLAVSDMTSVESTNLNLIKHNGNHPIFIENQEKWTPTHPTATANRYQPFITYLQDNLNFDMKVVDSGFLPTSPKGSQRQAAQHLPTRQSRMFRKRKMNQTTTVFQHDSKLKEKVVHMIESKKKREEAYKLINIYKATTPFLERQLQKHRFKAYRAISRNHQVSNERMPMQDLNVTSPAMIDLKSSRANNKSCSALPRRKLESSQLVQSRDLTSCLGKTGVFSPSEEDKDRLNIAIERSSSILKKNKSGDRLSAFSSIAKKPTVIKHTDVNRVMSQLFDRKNSLRATNSIMSGSVSSFKNKSNRRVAKSQSRRSSIQSNSITEQFKKAMNSKFSMAIKASKVKQFKRQSTTKRSRKTRSARVKPRVLTKEYLESIDWGTSKLY